MKLETLTKLAAPCRLAALGVAWVTVLGVTWTRGQKVLGNDAFFYVEFAKSFRSAPPDRFGDWWPFGFPLAGTLVSFSGLSAHASLWVVSAVSFFLILAGLWWATPDVVRAKLSGPLWILGFVSAPVCALSLAATLSEPFFSMALFGLAISMGLWPRPAATVWAICFALLAFSVRYAGVFTFGVVALNLWLRRNDLVKSGRLWFGLATLAGGVLVAALLCYTNYRHYGRIAGPQRVGEESLLSWPLHLADFGWSPVGAFVSGQALAKFGGIQKTVPFVVGLVFVCAIAGLCLVAWKRNSSPFSRPMAIVVVCYILAVVSLRATTPFDSVSSPRTFLPVMFPILFLLVNEFVGARPGFVVWILPVLLTLAGVSLAVRGMSPEVRPDVAVARETLAKVLQPEQTVLVNGPAASLSAYFPNRFLPTAMTDDGFGPVWGASRSWNPQRGDLTIIAPIPARRGSQVIRYEEGWLALIQGAIARGQVALVESNAHCIFLRAVVRSVPPGSR